ncbi:hypothetical protein N2601_24250 (plasmid) [Rhizobium sp. CB3060]|uniref:hypothetical protein n=1 Tax=unclassified Rhizobium TaxID=2613769 RepID=UPI0021A72616|nr:MULTISPECIES: hypothetical protein [Rhizobium]MDK4739926.1 hypothetical protein [Rhizobium sp. CNPSo 3464]UWU25245.1 hypothetical protein N2601_24250 [Rhizobium tropici]
MNTANLQLEGLLTAVASINALLVDSGIVSRSEMQQALERAQQGVNGEARGLSEANRKAMLFPIRLLLLANEDADLGKSRTFAEYAEAVGKSS